MQAVDGRVRPRRRQTPAAILRTDAAHQRRGVLHRHQPLRRRLMEVMRHQPQLPAGEHAQGWVRLQRGRRRRRHGGL